MKKSIFLILSALAIVLAGFWLYQDYQAEADIVAEEGVLPGKRAPSFSLNDVNGNNVAVAETGKIYVLNFWATWCPPCRGEMPELEAFAAANSANVNFYAINLQESAAEVNAFMADNQYHFPVLLDYDGKVSKEYQVRGIPTTLVIDRKGIIQFRKTGPVTQAELDAAVQKIMEDD